MQISNNRWKRDCKPRTRIEISFATEQPMSLTTAIHAPRGRTITCKGWHQEAALRMLHNNLDPGGGREARPA